MKPQDLTALLALLDERELDQVFYPVDQEHSLRPSEILSGVQIHAKHVLHPDYRHTPKYPDTPTRGLLGGWIRTQDDIDAEAVEHAANIEKERPLQAERIAAHWKKIKKNPVYKFLSDNNNFNEAVRLFKDKQAAKNANKKLKHPYAEFRFLRIVAALVSFFKLSDGRAFEEKSPDKRALDQTKRHIDKLLADFKEGTLTNGSAQRDLEKHLETLKDEIVAKLLEAKNAPRNDELRKYRMFAVRLTLALEREFGKASPGVVFAVAELIDCPLSQRTRQELISQARESLN